VTKRFEELDWQTTPMGELTLRRRFVQVLGVDVFEAILNDEHLMSTHFTVAENALGTLGVEAAGGDNLDVLVGGLGLGYTAQAVLDSPRVRSLTVIEAIDQVASWHRRHLLPLSEELMGDPRLTIHVADFFALMRQPVPKQRYDAILVDIDHTPSYHLHPGHAPFYTEPGLQEMARHLNPSGVFALWSDAPPDDAFLAELSSVFANSTSEVVTFDNALIGGHSSNTIYLAH
jgi:spermidine synthase